QSVLTYSDLERQSRQVAAIVLENRTKSQPIVAIFMEKGVHEIVSVIGVQRAAGAYLPVDVNQPPLRISQILKQAGVNLVLGQSHLRDKFPSTANLKFIAVDELPNQDEKIPELNIDSKALAYVIYTSGSTGVPKGVMISHQAAMNTIIDVNRRFNLGPSDCLIGVSRLSFDLSVYDIFGILSAGGRLVLPQPQEALDPLSWLKLIHNHSATVWNSVPALASLLIQTMENENQSAPSLRLTLFSGDWIGLDLTPRLKKLMPNLRAIALGGATEASIWSNFHQIEALDSSWTSVPYGKPLTNQAFRVLDNQLNDRPDWVPGDLYILGQGLALGYLNDNEKTAERFIESPDSQVRMYKTGDRARYRPDGVLEFLGRLDNQIKIHGYRIELGEIEAVLKTHPAVKEACATLYRGQNDEKALALFVVPHKDRQAQLTVIEQGPAPITENLAEAFRINEKDYSDLDRDRFLKTWDDLTELYLASALDALKKLGLFDSSSEPKTFPINLKIIERYHKWTKRAIKALEERGFIEKNTDWRYQPVKQTKELECLIEKTLVQIKAMGFNKKVGILLEKTARELSSILTEERHTAEFYTDESVPDLYQKTLAVCNHLTAQIAVKAAQLSSAKPYRILEVGAGYGTVTRHILPHLEREKVVYDFTDHSQFFLVASQREFAAYDFVNYSIFNLDIAPYLQAFRPHSYDLIIAGNVLHDVKNIRFSLNSLKGLLKPSGLAIIMEQTIFQLPLELTEGLQRGFENFEDRDLRKDHPLLSKENWLALLIEQGFEKPIFPMPSQSLEAHLGLEVIVTSGPEKVTRFDPEILETYLAERLPRYMIPNRYQILDKLPLTENGKIDRNSLSHSLGPIESQLSKFAPPRTELEKRLAEIWVETLKLERVGRNDSFFLIGGDSLSAFQLLRKLQKEFGRQISLKDLLEAPTISEQSELISSEQSSADLSLVLLNETQGPIGICLAHPIEGLVTSYAKLSKAMPQIPFFALQSRGLEGQCQPIYDFSVMIENYSRLIEPINKAHKLILGGWSMGAFIAWEMANKAEERGEKINQTPLILLDPPSKDLWDKRYGQRRGDLIFLTEQLSKEAAQILAGQAEASQGFDKLSRKEQIKLLAESLKEAGAINSKLEAELENVDNMLKVGLANLEALYQYQPKKLKNRSVIYFKAKDQNQESLSYWRSLTGGSFEIVETRSDHFNLLQSQEDISIIALKLNEVLAKALTALKKED
ncbi:MAG: amino acid adenylation domain-containing protein, partial [Deltaproteobacteria bacterium]|nr:amino acid adenylation domain-containing protein [Deltaproteobacteria bacterium]